MYTIATKKARKTIMNITTFINILNNTINQNFTNKTVETGIDISIHQEAEGTKVVVSKTQFRCSTQLLSEILTESNYNTIFLSIYLLFVKNNITHEVDFASIGRNIMQPYLQAVDSTYNYDHVQFHLHTQQQNVETLINHLWLLAYHFGYDEDESLVLYDSRKEIDKPLESYSTKEIEDILLEANETSNPDAIINYLNMLPELIEALAIMSKKEKKLIQTIIK